MIEEGYAKKQKKTLNEKKIEKLNYWIDLVEEEILALPMAIKCYDDILESYDPSVEMGIKQEHEKQYYIDKKAAVEASTATLPQQKNRMVTLRNQLIEENKRL